MSAKAVNVVAASVAFSEYLGFCPPSSDPFWLPRNTKGSMGSVEVSPGGRWLQSTGFRLLFSGTLVVTTFFGGSSGHKCEGAREGLTFLGGGSVGDNSLKEVKGVMFDFLVSFTSKFSVGTFVNSF